MHFVWWTTQYIHFPAFVDAIPAFMIKLRNTMYSGTSVYVHLGLCFLGFMSRFTYGDFSKMLPRFTYKILVYVRSSEKFGLQQVGESSEGV